MKTRFGTNLVAVIVGLFVIVPVFVVIPMSFSEGLTFGFPPKGFSLQWYESLFTSPLWSASIRNSLIIALSVSLIATVVGTLAALGIARLPRRAGAAVNGFIIAPIVIPQILIALAIYATFLQLRLNGTLIGIIAAHTAIAIPYVVISVGIRLQGMDSALRLAGLSLGATPATVFRTVQLPLLLPGVLTGAVLAFITSLDEVVIALFLQTPANITLPVQMFNSVSVEIDPTISAAASLIVVVVSTVILTAQLLALRSKKGRA
jgi:ABC-type spermidine/putrescine transport system permease subunit II